MRLADVLLAMLIAGCAVVFMMAVIHGFNKTLDIKDRTYYDTELGRTIYVEEGV